MCAIVVLFCVCLFFDAAIEFRILDKLYIKTLLIQNLKEDTHRLSSKMINLRYNYHFFKSAVAIIIHYHGSDTVSIHPT